MSRAIVVLVAGLVLIGGCSQKAQNAAANPDSTLAADRAKLEADASAKLDATRARLDSLKSEAAALGNKMDKAMSARIAELEVEKDSAQVQFAQLEQAGEDKWQEARSGFAAMLDSLDVKIDRARQSLHRS